MDEVTQEATLTHAHTVSMKTHMGTYSVIHCCLLTYSTPLFTPLLSHPTPPKSEDATRFWKSTSVDLLQQCVNSRCILALGTGAGAWGVLVDALELLVSLGHSFPLW